jgi:hypothetical protein
MAGKKISELSSSLSLSLTGVTPVVLNGTTYKTTLSMMRNHLVDSGSHYFTGSQHINGDLTITGSIRSLVVGTGSFHTNNPEVLHVQNAGSYNIAHFEANNQYYAQVNIKNINSGNNASSDLVLTADNGTEGVHYVNLGINSSTYTGGYVGLENDAYLINVGKDLYVGTVGGINHPANLKLFAQNSWEEPQITISGSGQIAFNTGSVSSGYTYEFSGSAKLQNDVDIVGELIIGSVSEKIVLNISGGTSQYEFDYHSGSVFYLTSSLSNNSYNVSNTPTESQRAVSITFIVKQESTPYIASSYKLNNETVTVSWAGNEQPTGNANKTDVIGLTALRVGSSWNVLGTFTTFG